jgi:Mg-chelatase subunit ChlD
VRNRRPRLPEINWNRTIISNLKNYQPKYKTVVPEKLIGYGRKRAALKDVILALDQSGSMAHRWSTRASSGR